MGLTFEITESVLIQQLELSQAALDSLNDLGVQLSLDNFGTGYGSLSYLSALRLNSIKIDHSLIRNIVATPHARALAAAIIDMGHALDLQVIAAGVETPEQAALLRKLGCDTAQGFHFAKPMSNEQFTALLHQPTPAWLS